MTIDELRIMADAAQCRSLTSYATALHAAADMLAARDAEIESLGSQLGSAWAVIKRQHDAGLRDKPEVSMERADLDAAIAGVCADLERENAELRKDAERWRYVRGVHIRSHSPHMDGTCGYSFRGLLNGLHRSADEAVDAAMAK